MKIVSDAVFLDTNILVHQTFEDFEPNKHKQTNELIAKLVSNDSSIFISTQILREYYAIVTNAKYFQTPYSPSQAIDKIHEYRDLFIVLLETENQLSILMEMVLKYGIKEQEVHDFYIVATLLANDIKDLATYNLKDFKKYEGIHLLSLNEQ